MSDSAEYIRRMYESEDRLCVALIQRPDGGVRQQFKSAAEIAAPRYQAYLHHENMRGSDVFVSVNSLNENATRRTKADVRDIRNVYLDIDAKGKDIVEKIGRDPNVPPPHAVLETSPDRRQVLWQVQGFSKDESERLMRGMSQHFGSDQAVWDNARVLRCPGFQNNKYPDKPIVRDITERMPERVWTPADFPTYQIERPEWSQASVHRMAIQPVRGGSQSEHDWAFACRALERGDHPAVIERRIAQYRAGDGKHADPERYAHMTVQKAQAHVASRPMPMAQHSRETRGMER